MLSVTTYLTNECTAQATLVRPLYVNDVLLLANTVVTVTKGNAASSFQGYSVNGDKLELVTEDAINSMFNLVLDDDLWF